MKSCDSDSTGAAILCEHVAREECPILRGRRDTPLSPEDSGWQFRCNRILEESVEQAKIWSIAEVIEADPSVASIVHYPYGTIVERASCEADWVVSRFDPDEES